MLGQQSMFGKGMIMEYKVFIEKSNIMHNNYYDYSKTDLTITPISIVCPVHGIFFQTIYNHVYGRGCKLCGQIKSNASKIKSTEYYLNKFQSLYNRTIHIP